MNKRITVLVSNDLVHDQRVRKVCESLGQMDFDIYLIGRKLSTNPELNRDYPTKRMALIFKKGVLFYAELQIRLLFFLLFVRTDIILANDLDTLMPAFIASRLRGKNLVYDSHEYFTEAAGLSDNSFAKNVWLAVEKWIFPKLDHVITVNESIASIYREKYGVDVKVVRNIPQSKDLPIARSRKELGLPDNKFIVLLQGAYIDPDRGAMDVAKAMKHLDGVLFLLIGSGEEWHEVKDYSEREGLEDKIILLPKQPFETLQQFTLNADLGLSVDKDIHLNYKLSLPNKLFDYIHAHLPVLVSSLPELRRVLEEFEIGTVLEDHRPETIARAIRENLTHPRREIWKQKLKEAALHYTWENEEKVLEKIYSDLRK